MYRSYAFDGSLVVVDDLRFRIKRTMAAAMHPTPASTPITMPAIAPPLSPDDDASEEGAFESEAAVKVFPDPAMNVFTESVHDGRVPESELSDTSSRLSWRNAPELSFGSIGPDKVLC